MMNVVLVEPEIPQNTGNVSRTCVLTNSRLHLIKPMGFSLDDRYLKRAGLDYWSHLNYSIYESWEDFVGSCGQGRFFFFSSKGDKLYSTINFAPRDYLIFGSETSGLPPRLIEGRENVFRLPMTTTINRSFNLSNTVAVTLFESLRQQGFPGLV